MSFETDTNSLDSMNQSALRQPAHCPRRDAIPKEQRVPGSLAPQCLSRQGHSGMRLNMYRGHYRVAFG